MISTRVWLNFFLPYGSDQSGLYRWLAKFAAKECSFNTATFVFESTTLTSLKADLEADLRANVLLKTTDKIYLIYPKDDISTTNKFTGVFLNGERTRAPWDNYTPITQQEDE
jgi:hypothetical protein